MQDQTGNDIVKANPGNLVFMKTDPPLDEAAAHGILRRRKK
jgi:hypothetical protein